MPDDASNSDGGARGRVRSVLLPRSPLRRRRRASLTEVERAFLSALLIDEPPSDGEDERARDEGVEGDAKVLNDDILFSIPFDPGTEEGGGAAAGPEGGKASEPERRATEAKEGEAKESRPKPPGPTGSNRAHPDSWKARGDGARPDLPRMRSGRTSSGGGRDFVLRSSSCGEGSIDRSQLRQSNPEIDCNAARERTTRENNSGRSKDERDDDDDGDPPDVPSDRRVGIVRHESEASSWSSSRGGFDHYDAWEVLRDEYAWDFGFDVAVDDEDEIPARAVVDDDEAGGSGRRGAFKILGTSADDATAAPHVLSPPLMDSLLEFVPERLAGDNLWLKFSLVRDGASLDILTRYCRAATHTILAIETTNGDVFGAFASSPWRRCRRYFGTGESFLWRMRRGRNTPVHCLFEQARLESEIDVFPYDGSNDYVQLCTADRIAMGGGALVVPREEEGPVGEDGTASPLGEAAPAAFLEDESYGFGLALDGNLLHGTTSPCATFGNSSLIGSSGSGGGGETFDVTNLEVWGFTSAPTVREAQGSELSVFFARESASSSSSTLSSSSLSSGSSTSASGRSRGPFDDASVDRFYRRVGQDDASAAERDAWRYASMMNPVAGSPYGKMSLPYGR